MKLRDSHSLGRTALLAALLILLAGAARAEDLRSVARRVAGQYAQAIVNVQIVLTQQISYGGQNNENEAKAETSGTVISSDGLTIVPLSAVDPAQLYRQLLSSQMGSQMNINSRVRDIKLIVNKRQEIPATVVLRDPDLNIALLRPLKKPDQPMKALDLTQSAEPQLLEEVFVMARLGRVADRELSLMTGEIQAIVKKPRTFYVPSSELASGGFGVPIFSAAGKVLGIVLMRTSPGGMEEGGLMSMNPGQSGMLVIILPTRDVAEMAAQAPQEAPKKAQGEQPPTPPQQPGKASK